MYPETEKDIRDFRRFLRRPSRRRLERVIRTYYAPIWRIAVRLSGNEDDANDIAQDVFLSLILNPPGPDGVRSPMGFLTYRAVSRARHMDRAAMRRRIRETEAARRIAAAENMAEEDLEEIRYAVRELPEPLRTAVELRYLSSLRNADIAATLAVSERTVERTLGQAREVLRSKLGKSALGLLLSLGTWKTTLAAAPAPPLGTFLRVFDMGTAIAPLAAASPSTSTPSTSTATSLAGAEIAKSKIVAATSIAGVLVLGLSLGFWGLNRMRIAGERELTTPPERAGEVAGVVTSTRAGPTSGVRKGSNVSAESSSPERARARLMKDRYLITGRIVENTTESGAGATVRPVEGARVDFKPHPRRADPSRAPPPERVVTGPDGTFAFGGIPWGMWLRLEIDPPERGVRTLSFNLGDPEGEGRIELGDIRVEKGLDLVIEASGPSGEPVSGAKVMVKRTVDPRLQAAGMYESHREAAEGVGGQYRLERMARGTLQVQVAAAGYSRFRELVAIPADGHVPVRLEEGQVIYGVVTTFAGEPIPDVELQIKGPKLILPFPTTRSDREGRFAFDFLSGGEYRIRARATGYVELKKRQLKPGDEPVALQLEPESVYSGQVLAAGDGTPVATARVTLMKPGQTAGVDTEADGRFVVRGLAEGHYFVTVDHDDHAPLYAGVLEVRPAEIISGPVLRLQPGRTAPGRITDAATGAGVEGAWVTLTPLDAPEEARRVKRLAKTAKDGSYVVAGLYTGSYSMTITAPGYIGGLPRTITVDGRTAEHFDFELTAGSSIRGTVLDRKGRPLFGAAVFLSLSPAAVGFVADPPVAGVSRLATPPRVHRISAQSDAEGHYLLEAVPPWDSYLITVTHHEHAFARVDGIAVGVGESIDGLDFVLGTGGRVRGWVTDPAGRGLTGVEIRYALERTTADGRRLLLSTLADRSEPGNDSTERFITLEDGTFTIPRLPAGSYTLTVQARDKLPTTVQGVEVREGRDTRGLRLVLQPGEILSGRVVSIGGGLIAGAIVVSRRTIPCLCSEFPTAVTDDDGRFVFRGLAPGAVPLTVKRSGFMSVSVVVELPASEDVLIPLDPAGCASGLVLAPVDVDYNAVRVHAVLLDGDPHGPAEEVRPDSSGEFTVDLASGIYRLVATAPDLAAGRSEVFTIVAGEALTGVDIPLGEGGVLEGVVVSGSTARTIEGARLLLEPADGSRWITPRTSSVAVGRFAFEKVAAGSYRLVVQHASHARKVLSVSIAAGENPDLEIVLESGGVPVFYQKQRKHR